MTLPLQPRLHRLTTLHRPHRNMRLLRRPPLRAQACQRQRLRPQIIAWPMLAAQRILVLRARLALPRRQQTTQAWAIVTPILTPVPLEIATPVQPEPLLRKPK
jgi:hypothetical protein